MILSPENEEQPQMTDKPTKVQVKNKYGAKENRQIESQTQLNNKQKEKVDQKLDGFVSSLFNKKDPSISKLNSPIKKQSSCHKAIIFTTLIIIGGVIGAVLLIPSSLIVVGIVVLVLTYVLYLILTICCSDVRGYVTNLKKFSEYKQTYDEITASKGCFVFSIECYHYITTIDSQGNTHTHRVTTHTATQVCLPNESTDQSGNITNIIDLSQYIFIKYQKKFYFADENSENIVLNKYRNFINRNSFDMFQDKSRTFQIVGLQPEVGFSLMGNRITNSIVFYVFTFLGLNLVYACILQRLVSRYEVNIIKRLKYT